MQRRVDILDIDGRSGRDAYEQIVNRPGVVVLKEQTLISIVPGGDGEGSERYVSRLVDYLEPEPTPQDFERPIA